MGKLDTVTDNINFAEEENKILNNWNENKIFERSLKYVYYKYYK